MIKIIIMDIDGVLTDGNLYINENGSEMKKIALNELDAVYEMHNRGYILAAITGENTKIVEYFKHKFPFDYFYSGCKNKKTAVIEIQNMLKLEKDEICYIGDGKYDIEAIEYSGLGVAPSNAILEVKLNADILLSNAGGEGCIKELLDILELKKDQSSKSFERVYMEHMDMFKSIYVNEVLKNRILEVGNLLVTTFKQNSKVLLCGNGGSAADAQHIATEFVSRFYMERKALNAEALNINTSSLTAIGNDYSFDNIFSRQIEAKGLPGDLLIAISTSGNSKNIILALKKAKENGLKTVLLTGENFANEEIGKNIDIIIRIPSLLTPRIQEAHIFIGHFLCEYVEKRLFEN